MTAGFVDGYYHEMPVTSVYEILTLMGYGFTMVRHVDSWYLVHRHEEDNTLRVVPVDWYHLRQLREDHSHMVTEHFIHMTLNEHCTP